MFLMLGMYAYSISISVLVFVRACVCTYAYACIVLLIGDYWSLYFEPGLRSRCWDFEIWGCIPPDPLQLSL